ncbi:hypothetical protein [Streptomyces sp. ITFR-6]|uniref:hypothetical protein n=1 Tax=Streptomyces sp. ITFR-6 TaxID=3075197 RepID=UPI002889F96F|nr:hypothetical protein [Streptomyces sp. ITFR-6]WNI34365.1 hypothetical protein RLT59_27075 [Streptomyces sp. ITFR-6]
MRSPARLVTGTAASALAAAALGLCTAAPSAYADGPGPLEITPASAAPGATVTVNTKACGSDTGATGDAGSLEASRFALAPATLKEVLAGSFRVPGNVEPGPYSIDVACENGRKATGEIEVEAAGTTGKDGAASRTAPAPDGSDDRSPADTGDSSAYDSPADSSADSPAADAGSDPSAYDSTGLDEAEAAGSALVPDSPTAPGRGTSSERPSPSGHESSGTHDSSASHDSSTGRDDSSSDHETPSGHRASAAPTAPTGHVKTGIGGSVGPDTTQIAAGAGVLAATAVGGAWLLRRRASGTRDDS